MVVLIKKGKGGNMQEGGCLIKSRGFGEKGGVFVGLRQKSGFSWKNEIFRGLWFKIKVSVEKWGF